MPLSYLQLTTIWWIYVFIKLLTKPLSHYGVNILTNTVRGNWGCDCSKICHSQLQAFIVIYLLSITSAQQWLRTGHALVRGSVAQSLTQAGCCSGNSIALWTWLKDRTLKQRLCWNYNRGQNESKLLNVFDKVLNPRLFPVPVPLIYRLTVDWVCIEIVLGNFGEKVLYCSRWTGQHIICSLCHQWMNACALLMVGFVSGWLTKKKGSKLAHTARYTDLQITGYIGLGEAHLATWCMIIKIEKELVHSWFVYLEYNLL